MDEQPGPVVANRAWLQVSLRTLLAVILGFGLGLAVNLQFHPAQRDQLPNPTNIRLGDRLSIEFQIVEANYVRASVSRRTTVLADGTITLPDLGQVPAAGLSLAGLTEDLKQLYAAHYQDKLTSPRAQASAFVSFADTSTNE